MFLTMYLTPINYLFTSFLNRIFPLYSVINADKKVTPKSFSLPVFLFSNGKKELCIPSNIRIINVISEEQKGDCLLDQYRRIRDLRYDNDITQKQMGDYLNCSQRSYSDYERGTTRFPISALIQLALFYDTSVDYLLNLTDDKRPHPRRKVWRNMQSVREDKKHRAVPVLHQEAKSDQLMQKH